MEETTLVLPENEGGMQMKVKDILAEKGSRVITCNEDNKVMEALAIFSANKVGSLLVVDQHDNIQGILAPRDVLMAMLHQPDTFKEVRVGDIMARDLIVGTPEDTISYIQALMTENRIRHVPVVEGRQLKGLVSIGDVVKAQMTETEVENRYLKEYMEGKYPA